MSTFALPHPLTERPTAPVGVLDVEASLDALELLDDHSRSLTVAPALAPAGHYLALGEGDEVRLLALPSRITHLGRGLTADVRLEDPRISRAHAIIVRHGRHARLLDNRSSTGTYVNGRRIIATNVQDGDVIALGPVTIRYVEIE